MNTINKLMLAGAVCSMTLATGARAVVIDNVSPVAVIDPQNQGDDTTYQNPNWSTGWTRTAGVSDTFAAANKAYMTGLAGVKVLNFESAQGFGTAAQRLSSTGSIFSPSNAITPYAATDSISAIKLTDGYTINLEYRTFSNTTKQLSGAISNSGVFLIADRAEASYTPPAAYSTNTYAMTSGSQGLIGGPSGGGVLFSFETDLFAFSANVNTYSTSSSSPTYIVAFFDGSGNLLGSYLQGIGNGVATEIGVYSSAGNIRSVWVGQNTSNNGVVIDDVAFVAVPEPATAGITFAGGLAMLTLLRKK